MAIENVQQLLTEQLGKNRCDVISTVAMTGKDYYAVFFADPDGLKLELCCAPYAYTLPTTRGDRDERRRIALYETQYQLDRG